MTALDLSLQPARVLPQDAGHVLGWALPLYLLLLSSGFAFLRSPMATIRGGELSVDRAAFGAINAVTGTGFTQTVGQDELTDFGRAGVTFMIAAGCVLMLTVGGALVSRIAGMGYCERTILLASIVLMGASGVIGSATLSDTPLHGAMQGIGAVANCGIVLRGTLAPPSAVSTMLVLLPLAVLGGIGVPVLLDIGRWAVGRGAMSVHSVAVLTMSAATYLLGTLLLIGLARQNAAVASAFALNSRSAGFNLTPLDPLRHAGQWMVLLLMAIGAAPGGAGGGWKVTTPLVIWKGMRANWRGLAGGRLFVIALAWTVLFASIIITGTWLIMRMEPQLPGDRVLFLAVSAASNSGLSNDPIALVGDSLFALSGIALAGRIVPIGILWLACQVPAEPDAIAVG
ncbi:MAG: hypothetical protein JO353_13585 [Phycisphaerae bacterium]|nr:hypothetical protein [Phycisphaerae bacterium]